jgi:hypothetical protein
VDSFFPPPSLGDNPCPNEGQKKGKDKNSTPNVPGAHVSRNINLWHMTPPFLLDSIFSTTRALFSPPPHKKSPARQTGDARLFYLYISPLSPLSEWFNAVEILRPRPFVVYSMHQHAARKIGEY